MNTPDHHNAIAIRTLQRQVADLLTENDKLTAALLVAAGRDEEMRRTAGLLAAVCGTKITETKQGYAVLFVDLHEQLDDLLVALGQEPWSEFVEGESAAESAGNPSGKPPGVSSSTSMPIAENNPSEYDRDLYGRRQ
jgi:hypothetical protein